MNKDQKSSRRVLARQVAVELPDESLTRAVGGAVFTTCDGTLTRDPRSGRDCTGQTDDIGFQEV